MLGSILQLGRHSRSRPVKEKIYPKAANILIGATAEYILHRPETWLLGIQSLNDFTNRSREYGFLQSLHVSSSAAYCFQRSLAQLLPLFSVLLHPLLALVLELPLGATSLSSFVESFGVKLTKSIAPKPPVGVFGVLGVRGGFDVDRDRARLCRLGRGSPALSRMGPGLWIDLRRCRDCE